MKKLITTLLLTTLISTKQTNAGPLYDACKTGKTKDVQAILKYINPKDIDEAVHDPNINLRMTPLFISFEKKCPAIAKLLIEAGANVNQRLHRFDTTPLLMAISLGYTDIVRQLIEKNADLNAADRDNITPLTMAIANNRLDITQLLIENGADVNKVEGDFFHGTVSCPLSMATCEGNTNAITLLIKHNADVNISNCRGITPLWIAATKGHKEAAQLLIKASANIDQKDDCDDSPLHKAAEMGHTALAQLLIDAGADYNKANDQGYKPIDIARRNGHHNIVTLLENPDKTCVDTWLSDLKQQVTPSYTTRLYNSSIYYLSAATRYFGSILSSPPEEEIIARSRQLDTHENDHNGSMDERLLRLLENTLANHPNKDNLYTSLARTCRSMKQENIHNQIRKTAFFLKSLPHSYASAPESQQSTQALGLIQTFLPEDDNACLTIALPLDQSKRGTLSPIA